MSKVTPNFKKDLLTGQAGELAIKALWPELELLHGKGADARLPNGELVELKTDTYDHAKTDNFFIEYMGNVDTGKFGGPWKAQKDGCQWFVYYFSNPGIAYVFSTEEMLAEMNAYLLKHNPKPIEIRNSRWTTLGWKVPRSLLSPVRVLKNEAK